VGDRRSLVLIAVVLAVAEIVDAFFVSFPAGPAVFAVLLLVGALWTRRGGLGGPILIAVLCVFEIANAPSWPRQTIGDWISMFAFAAVACAGLVVAIIVIRTTRSARGAAAA
jgi:hypothetical protein